jgi:hypothetical protein
MACLAMQNCKGGGAVVAMESRMRRSPTSVAAVERILALTVRTDRTTMQLGTELLWTIQRAGTLDRSNILDPLPLV